MSSHSHPRIRSLLQERAVKHLSAEYRLREDDTQAPAMAPGRFFYAIRATFELQKSNAD
jgi:hypothetical protein